jgi:hypothetical protein
MHRSSQKFENAKSKSPFKQSAGVSTQQHQKKIIQKETGDEDRRLGWTFGLNQHFGSVISVVKKFGFGK